MIWTKTDAGRAEMQTRALVKERVPRTLLLLIDGIKTDAQLLASVDGTSPDDFKRLEALGLTSRTRAADVGQQPHERVHLHRPGRGGDGLGDGGELFLQQLREPRAAANSSAAAPASVKANSRNNEPVNPP